ncbi:MAG: NYN domain-containing protein, partial [Acidimicrobiales bacterium]
MTATHVVVDGSNIATEGRSTPSLRQLEEAVECFQREHPHDRVTVVVDATFGHRIDPSERPRFEQALAEGRMLTPPAGAIGRGDAFILQIADKAGADVFSNDSFQEFHGQYKWLFDEGRLIGGKPVDHVGWVFVLRAPVRGPASRRSIKEARGAGGGRASRSARTPAAPDTAPDTSPAAAPARGGR